MLREVRRRNGVSQRALAVRAGTSQAAVSRLERDRQSPTVAHLQTLLDLMGEELSLEPRRRTPGHDIELLRENLRLTPTERLENVARLARFLASARGAQASGSNRGQRQGAR